MANLRARQSLDSENFPELGQLNLFTHLLRVDPKVIFGQIESGEREVSLQIEFHDGKAQARVQWLPEPDWLIVQVDAPVREIPSDPGRAAYREGIVAGAGNHLPEFAGGLSQAARGQPAKDRVPGIGRARIENSAGGD